MMRGKPTCIYNCEGLKELYDREFETGSYVIYCSTWFKPVPEVLEKGFILYAGNLGVGRHKSLIEIGEALHSIDSGMNVEVYGAATEQVREELEGAPGLRFHGEVSYEEICTLIRKSRLLIHTESFDDFTAMDTQFAFSTKLADYAASGIPVFLYGPLTGEGIRYFKIHGAAFHAENRNDLKDKLIQALNSKTEREERAENAVNMVELNHDYRKNSSCFRKIVDDI
jgi:hypothetical protein